MRQGIETQRLLLLRLLAGWLSLVAYLSTAPVAPVSTRWICWLLSSLLGRAEAAAQCLLRVQVRLLAEEHGIAVDRDFFSRPKPAFLADDADEPSSLADLRHRLLVLRCLLRNLPRRAMRVLRRLNEAHGAGKELGPRAPDAIPLFVDHLAVSQCYPPRRWHPPDKVGASFDFETSSLPPEPGRRRSRVSAFLCMSRATTTSPK